MARRKGLELPEAAYETTGAEIRSAGATGLLKLFGFSVYRLFTRSFPELDFIPWRFRSVPKGYWSSKQNHKRYFEWLITELDIQSADDWYNVGHKDIERLNGGGLLATHYKDSLFLLVEAHWSGDPVLEWCLHRAPNSFWRHRKNRARYLLWLSNKLSESGSFDWSSLDARTIKKNHGNGLLNYWKRSLWELLQDALPDLNVEPWEMGRTPRGFWDRRSNRVRFARWFARRQGITTLSGWYKVTADQVIKISGGLLGQYYSGSVALLVKDCFPTYKWKPEGFEDHKKSQQQLYRCLQAIYGARNVVWEFQSPSLMFPSGRAMRFDVAVPRERILFEYQGVQHFRAVQFFGGQRALDSQSLRDMEKLRVAKRQGFRLVYVSYRWEGSWRRLERL